MPGVKLKNNKVSENNFFANIITTSVFGAILASVAGSTIWQGRVFLYKEISIGNILEFAVNDYYIYFLLIFALIPVLSTLFKMEAEQ